MSPLPLICLLSPLLLLAPAELVSRYWGNTDRGTEAPRIYPERLVPSFSEVELLLQRLPLDERQVGYLTHDRGSRVVILDDSKRQAMEVICLEYEGNSPRFFFDLFNHPPERCMASTGAEVNERSFSEIIDIKGHPCLLESLVAKHPGEEGVNRIFKLVWIHPAYPVTFGGSIHIKRVRAALATVPRPPALLAMAGLRGFDSAEEARAFLEKHFLSGLKLVEVEAGRSR